MLLLYSNKVIRQVCKDDVDDVCRIGQANGEKSLNK